MAGHCETIQIRSRDGITFGVRIYRRARKKPAPVVVCTPAMGVDALYYEPLALALEAQGMDVVTTDLRGIGLSSVRAERGTNFGYHEIVSHDLPALAYEVRQIFPHRPVFWLGHSLGGQLNCLFASAAPASVAGLILVASCSVFYRGWRFPLNVSILLFEQSAYLLARLLGYFPGRLFRFGGREAPGVLRDWSRQGLTGRYTVKGNDHDFEALLAAMDLPVLAFSFTDDGYAPKPAVQHLLSKMSGSRITHAHVSPSEVGVDQLGHFGWVKRSDFVAPRIRDWLNEVCRDLNP